MLWNIIFFMFFFFNCSIILGIVFKYIIPTAFIFFRGVETTKHLMSIYSVHHHRSYIFKEYNVLVQNGHQLYISSSSSYIFPICFYDSPIFPMHRSYMFYGSGCSLPLFYVHVIEASSAFRLTWFCVSNWNGCSEGLKLPARSCLVGKTLSASFLYTTIALFFAVFSLFLPWQIEGRMCYAQLSDGNLGERWCCWRWFACCWLKPFLWSFCWLQKHVMAMGNPYK